ncbi:hypothetical protein NDI56_20145 [Haloarcula sp. S1CR25-12]|uniref:DUF1295 domain-containing protein n=1 Tax=Haloarcula saliterrae TaxID=2950534 RepID=A0ABU2FHI1_9EURY|nr:hypothetical protein [Haloarcula sp. S1CR25-12]MDS0261718.1 hypothetical protein [Haloarcula sp. S1CR25-12]
MPPSADATNDEWWVVEQQLWYLSTMGGLIGFSVGIGGLLLSWGLIAVGWAAQLNKIGVTQVGVAVFLSLLLVNIIYHRLRSYAFLIFTGLSRLATLVVNLDQLDAKSSYEFCHESRPILVFGFGWFAAMGLAFFQIGRWTCFRTYSGGPLHIACTSFAPGFYRALTIFFTQLQFAGFGVGGILFVGSFIIEIRCSWRRSRMQQFYHSSSLYTWLHPMAAFRKQLEQTTSKDEDSDE